MRIPDTAHAELLNWSRWCWLGAWPHPLPATHCGSGESAYRAPPEYDDEVSGAPEPLRIRPNERNAKIVQTIWERLPQEARLVVKAEYPGRVTSGRDEGRQAAANNIGVSLGQYEAALEWAAFRVEAAFAIRT